MLFKNKAILIVHGFAGGTYDEEYLAKYLELNNHFDVFTFTLPGHDVIINAKVKAVQWIDATRKEIDNLIKVGYKDIYLIGHSMGGVLVTILAPQYKEVKKLILLAPAFEYLIFKDDNLSILESIKHSRTIFKGYDSDVVLSRVIKFPISVVKEFMNLVKKYHTCYKNISVPTMIIQGDADGIVPLKSSKKVYDKLPCNRKKLIILRDVNHDICRSDKKDEVNAIVLKCLQNNRFIDNSIEEV